MIFCNGFRQVALSLALLSALAAQNTGITYVGVISGHDASVRGTIKVVDQGIAASSGAQIAAGAHNAVIHLTRGGDISVCRKSAVTLNAYASQLLIGLQSGTIDAKYPLAAAPDTLLTADFRMTVASGGRTPAALADYRIAMGPGGELLVQVLSDSDASVQVASLFDDVHANVRPGEMRAFVSSTSTRNAEQIAQTVALRCPVEEPRVEAASIAESPPPGGKSELEIPLAYQSAPVLAPSPPPLAIASSSALLVPPPVPPTAVPRAAIPATSPETASASIPSGPVATVAPRPVVMSPPAARATLPAHPQPQAKKGDFVHVIGRFFRHIFGGGPSRNSGTASQNQVKSP